MSAFPTQWQEYQDFFGQSIVPQINGLSVGTTANPYQSVNLGPTAGSGVYTLNATTAPAASRTLSLVDPLAAANVVTSSQQTVAQGTSITTGVTSNSNSVVITTQSASAAAGATSAFTFTNSYITSTSLVMVSINNYSGTLTTNGIPVVSVGGVTGGSCTISISNAHSANALSGTLKLAVLVC